MSLLINSLQPGNIYFRNKKYSSDDIINNINNVCNFITKKSISNSPFIYLFASNHIKTVYSFFGIIKAGKICVIVDPKIGKLELLEMLRDTPPGIIINFDTSTDEINFNLEFDIKHYKISEKNLENLEDVCLIHYTNASDGWQKGAMLTNRNLITNAKTLVETNFITTGTVTCSVIALHHMFSLQTGVITPIVSGGDILIVEPDNFYKITNILEQLINFKTTHIYSAPIVYYFLQKSYLINELLKTTQTFVSGGIKLPKKLFETYKEKYKIRLQEGYGLTEASPICSWHKPNDQIKIESVGKVFPCCEIQIRDDEDNILPYEKTGEICVKGKNVMKGYYKNNEYTSRILKNGWLHTGDIGKIDEQGYVYYLENKKGMLNYCGNKIYIEELKRLLKKNINVVDVKINKKTDELLGEFPEAEIELRKKGDQEQKKFEEWCYDNITKYKIPRKFNYI
jgi:long-chain acyl-CoA synthetase